MADIQHADRAHAPYSPSSLEAREACPGWTSRNEATIWADDGEACHEAAEALLRGDDSRLLALPADLQYFVRECHDYVTPRIAGYDKLVLEQTLFHSHPTLKDNSFGTPDLYTITGTSAQIFDYKFGRRPVTPAERNLQGWTYALALWDSEPTVNELSIHFIVPRVHNGTSSCTFTRGADYSRFLTRVLRTVERSLLPESEKAYHVAWESCAYCGRKSSCVSLATAISMVHPLTDEIHYAIAGADDTPTRKAARLNLAKLAKDWAEQTEEEILKQAMDGDEIEGFEVRVSSGKTTLKSLDQIAQALDGKISLEDLARVATMPVSNLKKLYVETVQKDSKTEAEDELMTALAMAGALKTGNESPYLYRLNKTK